MRTFLIAALVVFSNFCGLERTAFAKDRATKFTAGCYNDILKRGYSEYLPANQMVALTALYLRNQRARGPVTTNEMMEEAFELADIDLGENPLQFNSRFLVKCVYPLERKEMVDVMDYQFLLDIEINGSGKRAARNNLAAFFDFYRESCERRRAKLPLLSELEIADSKKLLAIPDMHLTDYLLMIPFMKGAHLGTYEVYEATKKNLTYYFEWHPRNPGSTRQRLIKLVEAGYLNYIVRGRQGMPYIFAISERGKEEVRRLEDFYLNLLKQWLAVEKKQSDHPLKNDIKALLKDQ